MRANVRKKSEVGGEWFKISDVGFRMSEDWVVYDFGCRISEDWVVYGMRLLLTCIFPRGNDGNLIPQTTSPPTSEIRLPKFKKIFIFTLSQTPSSYNSQKF